MSPSLLPSRDFCGLRRTGRLTGKAGVCLSTLGPGALNFSTAVAYALLGATPMILITGQKGMLSPKQARFQIVDVVASLKPVAKLARQIVSAVAMPTMVREALQSVYGIGGIPWSMRELTQAKMIVLRRTV